MSVLLCKLGFDPHLNPDCFDEMFNADGRPRTWAEPLVSRLQALSSGELRRYQNAADSALRAMGITFNVYGNDDGTEKVWPFDIVPRIVDGQQWLKIESGLKQRARAINLFLRDIYGPRHIIQDLVISESLIATAKSFRDPCRHIRPPHDVWCHVGGTDLVRNSDGQFYVLEDNVRCPSGVSYVLENREVMKRTFPQIFDGHTVASVEDYPERLLEMLIRTAPLGANSPTVVVLTPGMFNSAHFEHAFLAQQMGVELVEGSDLFVSRDDFVYMRTTRGPQRVDVIYRRIDDLFLDPSCFRSDSLLGVDGLMRAYQRGHVTLANAPGTGIADDKAVYAHVPDMIRYYLAEDAILPNVPTFLCWDELQRDHVLSHLDELVVKPTNESGGYGILMGPQATTSEREEFARRIQQNPREYIAQPMLSLSTVPTIVDDACEPRHVDLRPFVLHGRDDVYVLPGGLTRVALPRGSMIVNSSQGGGSKDTWVLADPISPEHVLRRQATVRDRPAETVAC